MNGKARITDLGVAVVRILDEPTTTTIAEFQHLIESKYEADLAAARERIAELERVCETALDFYALPTRDWVARYGAGMTTRDLGDMFRAALRTQEAEA